VVLRLADAYHVVTNKAQEMWLLLGFFTTSIGAKR